MDHYPALPTHSPNNFPPEHTPRPSPYVRPVFQLKIVQISIAIGSLLVGLAGVIGGIYSWVSASQIRQAILVQQTNTLSSKLDTIAEIVADLTRVNVSTTKDISHINEKLQSVESRLARLESSGSR